MQQDRGETEAAGRDDQQEHQQSAPLRCPRCNSTDTKFRYYSNNDRGQPRHYCKTCRRYRTVVGSLRNIPFCGVRRSNGKPTKDSPSLYSSISSVSPNISSSDEWEHKLHHQAPLVTAVSAPNSHASSCAHDLNDEISCLAAIQSLTQSHATNESFNTRNHFGGSSADITISQERNFHSMRLHQPLPQVLNNFQATAEIIRPVNLITGGCIICLRISTIVSASPLQPANASNWNNSSGNTNEPETARTSMTMNDWPHLSNYGGPT